MLLLLGGIVDGPQSPDTDDDLLVVVVAATCFFFLVARVDWTNTENLSSPVCFASIILLLVRNLLLFIRNVSYSLCLCFNGLQGEEGKGNT